MTDTKREAPMPERIKITSWPPVPGVVTEYVRADLYEAERVEAEDYRKRFETLQELLENEIERHRASESSKKASDVLGKLGSDGYRITGQRRAAKEK